MDPVANLLDRPRRYDNVDGTAELSAGLFSLGYAALVWLKLSSPERSFWNGMYALLLFVGATSALVHYGARAVKNRITYPRTGYVRYRAWESRWRPSILGAVIAVLATVGFAVASRRHWDLSTVAPMLFTFGAASYAYTFARTVPWKWAVAGLMALGSLIIAALPPEALGFPTPHPWNVRALFPKLALTFAMYGGLLLVSGGVSFALYLRRAQPPIRREEPCNH